MKAENKSHSGPWLFFNYEKQIKKHQIFFSLAERRCYARNIAEMNHTLYCQTPQGWMLILCPDGRCYLLEPVTMVKKFLPRMEWDFTGRVLCILSCSPSNPNCEVLCADLNESRLFFCHPEDKKWVSYEYSLGEDDLANIVSFNGKFYGLSRREKFLAIECPPRPSINVLESLNLRCPAGLTRYTSYLVESCGDIYAMHRFYGTCNSEKTVHIAIMKRDFSKQAWEEVDNVDGRVIFLGYDDFSASRPASEPGIRGNCIYFVENEDKRLYCFDLEEGCISVDMTYPGARSNGLRPLWIMPVL